DKLFNDTNNFSDACTLKYVTGKNYGWRCVAPSGTTSGKSDASGSICIPPRRRRLYVGKLEEWATNTEASQKDETQVLSVQTTSSPSNSRAGDALREAFIQSAAVETFFSWHEYKEEKKTEEKKETDGEFASFFEEKQLSADEKAQKELESGEIPDDFKRQMFYTYADYRDIFFGKDMGSDVNPVKANIDSVFNNSSRTDHKTPDDKRKAFWETYGSHIWEGMLCSLSYNTNDKKMDLVVRKKLIIDHQNNNNYTSVKFPSKSGPSADAELKKFSEKPQFVRWFEEWSEDFCRKKNIKIKKIKNECRSNTPGKMYCSGDGYDCEHPKITSNDIFVDLYCRDCEKECINYKKWILKKKKEFDKQKNKCEGEIKKSISHSNKESNVEFYNYLNEKSYSSVETFLASLNHCKHCQGMSDQSNKIDFKDSPQTFGHSTYCTACPVYGLVCKSNVGCSPKSKNNENKTEGKQTSINILVDDGATNDIDKHLKGCSKQYSFFKGLRKQEWECQKKYGIDQCNLKNAIQHIDIDKDISFNELFQRWLRFFVHDYNKLKDKIYLCIKREDTRNNKCIKECNDKCKCVEEWLEIKEKEWNNVKEHYKKENKPNDYGIPHWVKSYFEQEPFDTDYQKAQEVVEEKNKRDELWGCTGGNLKEGEDAGKCDKGDFITNLIDKLKKKIAQCKEKHIETTDKPCNETLPELPFLTPDEIDPFDDFNYDDNHHHHIQQPNFCPPPMTCVERAAKQLREEAERRVNKKLEGTGLELNGKCNKLQKNDAGTGEQSCEFEKTYKKCMESLDQQCKGKGKERFNIGQEWKCEYIKDIGKHICIPPRREHMCLDALNTLWRSTVNDSNDLLKKVQEAAEHEGNDIIRKLLEQNSCDEHRISDAMKYSFADLGDIIRGRDLLNENRKAKGLQRRLQNAFLIIYNKLDKDNLNKYKNGFPHYYKLRSDWWDVNRKHVWNAMTCNAPKDAKLNKRNEEPEGTSTNGSFVSTLDNCGYEKDPPDYDYIPQPFRWMQEWSESFCKLLNKELNNFKNECKECKHNGITCIGDENGKKCEKCKKQCKNYQELIDKWKSEFDKYKDTYKEIYNNNAKISSEEYVNKFLEKLKDECKGKDSADKYLDEASHCKKYKFTIDSVSNNSHNYAFENPPKGYKDRCECQVPDPLDQCPDDDKHENVCKNLSITTACRKKYYNHDDSWTSVDVKDSKGKNHGVLVPPRRRQLCIRNMNRNLDTINNISDFKKIFLQYVYTEGYYLWHKYKNDNKNALDAMHYSFYDYGDIVKGTDMLDTTSSRQINKRLTELLNASKNGPANVGSWWRKNKKHIWYAMLCGYNKSGGHIKSTECVVPKDDDETPQFLRWFREWTEHFCATRQKLFNEVKRECESAKCNNENGKTDNVNCEGACVQYKNYITRKIEEYRLLNYQYNVYFKKQHAEGKNAPEYFNDKCISKCNCLSQHIDKEKKWKNIYDSLGDNNLKNKCDCIKIKPQIIPNREKPKEETKPPLPDLDPLPADEPFDPTILQTTIPFGIAVALGSIAFLFLK
ncbi:hypothetical protein PFMC_05263, partial [Plasmodium falciparum CAMP/Malaysia]